MLSRNIVTLLLATLVHVLIASTASAQSAPIDTLTPQDPVKFSLFEEENWYLLADEPGLHIARAREAFVLKDLHAAAIQLRKAAVHLRIAANDGTVRTKRGLKHAQHELEKTADRIEAGTLKSVASVACEIRSAAAELLVSHAMRCANVIVPPLDINSLAAGPGVVSA